MQIAGIVDNKMEPVAMETKNTKLQNHCKTISKHLEQTLPVVMDPTAVVALFRGNRFGKILHFHCRKGTILQHTESVQNSIQHHKILHIVE